MHDIVANFIGINGSQRKDDELEMVKKYFAKNKFLHLALVRFKERLIAFTTRRDITAFSYAIYLLKIDFTRN